MVHPTPEQPPSRRPDPEASAAADEALEQARSMPPGPERVAALKKAGLLRYIADLSAIVFARKGRPPK